MNVFLGPFRAVAVMVALLLPVGAWSVQIQFTISGTFDQAGFGYTANQPFQFNFLLNNYAPVTPAGNFSTTVGGHGALAWIDNAPGVPQIWSSITGTGLAGSWTPTITSASQVAINVAGGPTSQSSLQLYANSGVGVTANGFDVKDLQVGNVYLQFFPTLPDPPNNVPPPDPTQFFLSLLGTYNRDQIFSPYGRIYGDGPNGGGLVSFTANTLTIAAVVPEPEIWAMLIAGLGAVTWMARRRSPKPKALASPRASQ